MNLKISLFVSVSISLLFTIISTAVYLDKCVFQKIYEECDSGNFIYFAFIMISNELNNFAMIIFICFAKNFSFKILLPVSMIISVFTKNDGDFLRKVHRISLKISLVIFFALLAFSGIYYLGSCKDKYKDIEICKQNTFDEFFTLSVNAFSFQFVPYTIILTMAIFAIIYAIGFLKK